MEQTQELKPFHRSARGEIVPCTTKIKCLMSAQEDHIYAVSLKEAKAAGQDKVGEALVTAGEFSQLVNELHEAAETYYKEDESETKLTDAEYDRKLQFLKEVMDENTEYMSNQKAMKLYRGFNASDDANSDKLLSQGKIYTETGFRDFIGKLQKNGVKSIRLQPKFDGMTLSAEYVNGELVDLSSRKEGRKNRQLENWRNNELLETTGLPLTLSGKLTGKTVELRGELFMLYDNFHSLNEARNNQGLSIYQHPRGAAVASLKNARTPTKLNFVVWQVIDKTGELKSEEMQDFLPGSGLKDSNTYLQEELSLIDNVEFTKLNLTKNDYIASLGHLSIDSKDDVTCSYEQILNFGVLRRKLNIPTDGAVLKPDKEDEMINVMGWDAHGTHNLSQMAYKFEGISARSTVKSFNWTAYGDGSLYLSVAVEPTFFKDENGAKTPAYSGGMTIDHFMESGLKIGNPVELELKGDIKPKISKNLAKGNLPHAMMEKCPICGSKLKHTVKIKDDEVSNHFKCSNQHCTSRKNKMMEDAFSSMNSKENKIANSGWYDATALSSTVRNNLLTQNFNEDGLSAIEDWIDIVTVDEAHLKVLKKEDGSLQFMTKKGWSATLEKALTGAKSIRDNISDENILAGAGISHLSGTTNEGRRKALLENRKLKDLYDLTVEEIRNLIGDSTTILETHEISFEDIHDDIHNSLILKKAIKTFRGKA